MGDFFFLAIVSIYFGSVDAFMNGSCNFERFIKYIIKTDLSPILHGIVVHFKTILYSLI